MTSKLTTADPPPPGPDDHVRGEGTLDALRTHTGISAGLEELFLALA